MKVKKTQKVGGKKKLIKEKKEKGKENDYKYQNCHFPFHFQSVFSFNQCLLVAL